LAGSVARALRPEHAAAVALLLAEALVVHLSCVLVHERVVADNNRQRGRNNPKKIHSLPFNPFLPLKTREGRWFFRFLDLGIAS
jgi:quinol-cytochrome oxidoreductase complex cytochrome b subunit